MQFSCLRQALVDTTLAELWIISWTRVQDMATKLANAILLFRQLVKRLNLNKCRRISFIDNATIMFLNSRIHIQIRMISKT